MVLHKIFLSYLKSTIYKSLNLEDEKKAIKYSSVYWELSYKVFL